MNMIHFGDMILIKRTGFRFILQFTGLLDAKAISLLKKGLSPGADK